MLALEIVQNAFLPVLQGTEKFIKIGDTRRLGLLAPELQPDPGGDPIRGAL